MCDPALLPEDRTEQSSQMSSLDLYEDLLVSENQGEVNRVLSIQEVVAEKRLLEEQNKKLLKQLAEIQQKSQDFQAEKQNIERNFNTLLATAKVELARKNKLLSHYVGGSGSSNRAPSAKSARKIPNQPATKQKNLLTLYKGSRVEDKGPSVKPSAPALLQHRGEKMVGVATKVFSNSCDKNTTISSTISQTYSTTDSIQSRINENQDIENITSLSRSAVPEQLEQNDRLEPPELAHGNTTVIHENNALESCQNSYFNSRVSVSKEQYSVELYDRPCSNGRNLLSETTKKLQTRLNEDRSQTSSVVKSNKPSLDVCQMQPQRSPKRKEETVKNLKAKTERRGNFSTDEVSNSNNRKSSAKLFDLPSANQQTTSQGKKKFTSRRGHSSIIICSKKSCEETTNSFSDRLQSRSKDASFTQRQSASTNFSLISEKKENARKTKYSTKKKTTGESRPLEINRAGMEKHLSLEQNEDRKKKGMPVGSSDLRNKLTNKKHNVKGSNYRPESSSNEKFCDMTRKISKDDKKRHKTSENEVLPSNFKSVKNKSKQEIEKDVSALLNPETLRKESIPEVGYNTMDAEADGVTDYLNFHGDEDLDYDENSLMHCDLMKLDHAEGVKDKADKTMDGVAESPPVTVFIHSSHNCEVENDKPKISLKQSSDLKYENAKNGKIRKESINDCMSIKTGIAGQNLKDGSVKSFGITGENTNPNYQPHVKLIDIAKSHLSGNVTKRKISNETENESQCIKKRKETISPTGSDVKSRKCEDADTNKFACNSTCQPHNEKLSFNKGQLMKPSESETVVGACINHLERDAGTPCKSSASLIINSRESAIAEKPSVNNWNTSNAKYDISDSSHFQTPVKKSCSSVVHKSPAFNTRSKKKLDSASLVSDLRMMLEGDEKLSSLSNSEEKKVKDNSQISKNASLHKVKTRLMFSGDSVENNGRKLSDVTHNSENQSYNLTGSPTEAADVNAMEEKLPKNSLNQHNLSTDVAYKCTEDSTMPSQDRSGLPNIDIANTKSSADLDVAMEVVVTTTPTKKSRKTITNSDVKIKKNSKNFTPGTLKIKFKARPKKANRKKRSESVNVKELNNPTKNLQNDKTFSNIVTEERTFFSDDSSSPVGSFEPSPELNKWLVSASKGDKKQKRSKKRKRRKRSNIELKQLLSSSDEDLKANKTHKIDSCELSEVTGSYGFDVENSTNMNGGITEVYCELSKKISIPQSSEVRFVPSAFPELDATQHIDDAMCSYKNAALQFLLHDARIRLDALTASFTEEPLDLSLGRTIQTSDQPNISKDSTVLSPLDLTSIVPTDAAGHQRIVPKARPHTDMTSLMTATEEKLRKCRNTNQVLQFDENSTKKCTLTKKEHIPVHSSQQDYTEKDVSIQKNKNITHKTYTKVLCKDHRKKQCKDFSTQSKKSLGDGEKNKHTNQNDMPIASEYGERKDIQHGMQTKRPYPSSVNRRHTNGRESEYYNLQHDKSYRSPNRVRRRSRMSHLHQPNERDRFSRTLEAQPRDHRSNRNHCHRDGKSLKKRIGETEKNSCHQIVYSSGRSTNDDNWDQLLKEHSKQQQRKPAERQKPSSAKKKPRRVTLERVDLPPTERISGSAKKLSPPSRNLWMSSLKECQERRKKRARWSSDVCESELPSECLQTANMQFIEGKKATEICSKEDVKLMHISSDRTSLEAAGSPLDTSRNASHDQSEINVRHADRFQDNFESRSSSHMSVVIPELSASSWQLSEESRAQFYSFAKVIKMLSPLKSSPGNQRLLDKGTTMEKKHVRRKVLQ